MTLNYYAPTGGHPSQTELTTNRAVFTEAYAVLPRGTMRDIVTSYLPFWSNTRLWVIAWPLSGFAETFSQYIVEVSSGRRQRAPRADPIAEGVLFVVDGLGSADDRERGPCARPPVGTPISHQGSPGRSVNDRRPAARSTGFARPTNALDDFVLPRRSLNERDIAPIPMPGTKGALGCYALRRPGRRPARHHATSSPSSQAA